MPKQFLPPFLLISLIILAAPPLAGQETTPQMTRIAVDELGGGDATISPDGTCFLTTSRRSGNWDLWMYEIATSQWTQLTHDAADDLEGRFSPDGKRVVFCSTRTEQKDLWVLNVETKELKRITDSAFDDEYPVWSPDGTHIVYTSGPWKRRHIYQVPVTGGPPQPLTRVPSFLGACSFYASGNALVCHRYDAGNGDLFRLSRTGGETSRLTTGPAWDYKPVPSPDGAWIAFSRSAEGPSHIWLMSNDGRISRQLTDTPHEDRWPTWSRAGELLFHRIVEEGRGIKLLDLESGSVNTLVSASESPLCGSLDPGGTRLVYSYQDKDRKRLKIRNISTGQVRLLETGDRDVRFPRWSPDGQTIAYVMRGPRRWDICVTDVDGTGQVNLTEAVTDLNLRGMDGPLDWSPDGSRIVFHADTEAFAASLFAVDINSRQVTRLTEGPFFDEAPAWSPDGRSVVFMSTRGGNWTWCFYQLDLQRKSMKQLTEPNWVEKNFPRISPSGELVFATVDDQGQHVLAQLDASGKRQIIPEAGTGVRWPSFSGDHRQVVFSSVGRRVEYWLATHLPDVGPPAPGTSPPGISWRPEPRRSHKPVPAVANVGSRSPVDLYHR